MRNPNLSANEQRAIERRLSGRGSPLTLLRLIAREPIAATLAIALFGWGALALSDIAAWQSNHYPEFLISQAPADDLEGLRARCGSPLEVKPTSATVALTRCGMFWPAVSVWRVPRAIVDPRVR